MARYGEDDSIYDDDAVFNDESFLSVVANVEAQHLGRLTNVLSCGGARADEGQIAHGTKNAHSGRKEQNRRADELLTDSAGKCSADEIRKRRRIQEDSRSWPSNTSGQDKEAVLGSRRDTDAQPEGEYMAALRGSNSELWQNSAGGRGGVPGSSNRGAAGFSNRGAAPGNTTSGGDVLSGTCYKCGMEGHWAKECTSSRAVGSPTKAFVRDGHAVAPAVPERLCACGAGACIVLTANTEKNPGRSFYRCPLRKDEGQCPFFEWCDAGGQNISDERSNWQAFPQQSGFSQHSQPQLPCKCGGGPCLTLTAKTEKNMGRQFYKCPLPQGQSCSFFQWCDELGKDVGGSYAGTPSAGSTHFGNVTNQAPPSGPCFKCGREGHWSRDCQNQYPQHTNTFDGQSQIYTSSGATQSKTSGNCYKCGGQGHWSNSCPTSRGPPGHTPTKTDGGGSVAGGGSCYKCGEPGHWANRCPMASGGQRYCYMNLYNQQGAPAMTLSKDLVEGLYGSPRATNFNMQRGWADV